MKGNSAMERLIGLVAFVLIIVLGMVLFLALTVLLGLLTKWYAPKLERFLNWALKDK